MGPTATGKTRLAIELCRALDGEIVGADSVQVYRGFDIGSGKATAAELGGVRHHLVDILEPQQRIDAARFAELADAAIADIHRRGKLAVIAGGTGLWLRALLSGLLSAPEINPALRSELEARWHEDREAAHRKLTAVDPLAAAKIHVNDMVRVVRALEYHAQTGRPLGTAREHHGGGQRRYRGLHVLLDLPLEVHRTVVSGRVEKMLAAGWLEETRLLVERHGLDIGPLSSVGYRQLCEHLRGELTLEETRQAIKRATRLYAKRQRTFFRGEREVDLRLDAREATVERIGEQLRRRWGAGARA